MQRETEAAVIWCMHDLHW